MSIYDLALKRRMLPTKVARWCCADFKENAFPGTLTATGVRKSESIKRSKRNEMGVSHNKFAGTQDDFFGEYARPVESEARCIRGKECIILNPIIDWTENDVWDYLNDRSLPHCELYDQGWHRVGCIGCPMATPKKRRADFERWPHSKHRWLETITKLKEMKSKNMEKYIPGALWHDLSPDEIFEYWISGLPYKAWVAENKIQLHLDL